MSDNPESPRRDRPLGPRPSVRSARHDDRTLVIQTAHLGDVVLTLPLIQRLAERHGPVDVVTTPAALPLVETHSAVRRAIPFAKHDTVHGLRGMLRFGRDLGAVGYARVYLPHRSLRSAILGWLTRARERIGYAQAAGAFLYTRRVPVPTGGHATDRFLALTGNPDRPERPWLALTADDRASAHAWLSERGIPDGFIVLAPGSRWGTKRWPYFAELAKALESACVVIGSQEDIPLADAVIRTVGKPGRVRSAAGELPLRQSAAVIERASLIITNDSIALHLASALARPVVALFGPTVPGFGFGPVGEDDTVIEHPALPCRPCSDHGPMVCPLGHHRCLRDLGVERVLTAVRNRQARLGAR